MNLYLISQSYNNDYDTYDEAVVAAESLHDAKLVHPSGNKYETDKINSAYYSWCHPDYVDVKLIGIAKEGTQPGVICASFNAG